MSSFAFLSLDLISLTVFGFYGIVICFCVLLVDLCKDGPYEVSELSPLAPFAPAAMRDTFMRLDWRKLGDRDLRIQNMEK